MKKFSLLVIAGAALAAIVPAAAQDAKPAANAETKKVEIPAEYWKRQKPGQYLIKDRLLGQAVRNKEGKVIGDIEDVIIGDDHQIVGVVMGVGGFLGVGEKKVAVRYRALKVASVDGKIVITLPSATKEVLTALLPYERLQPKKSVLEKAKDKAEELKDKSVETAKDAAEKAKAAAAPVVEKAKEGTKAAVEKAKEVGKAAVEKAKEATGAAKPAEGAAKQ